MYGLHVYNVFLYVKNSVCSFQGFSPYKRATYRYTPILAWVLTLNTYLTPLFGKLVFILCDIGAGYLIHLILVQRGVTRERSWLCAYLWLFNPLVMTVSSRGNAESIMAMLVLATFYYIIKKEIIIAAVIYAISVHVKIYPATYILPIYLLLNNHYNGLKGQVHVSKYGRIQTILKEMWPNKERGMFLLISALTFLCLTALCYHL